MTIEITTVDTPVAAPANAAEPLRIFIIAGEQSGDNLGGSLMESLNALYPGIEFRGIGGAQMQAEGLSSLFPMEELSVMGITEVIPRLPKILARMRQTVKAILDFKPHALVTIDSPDFCFRIAKKVKAKTKDIPCIHYVAPSVWAWRPERAQKVAGFLDHLLTLLPFEPPYFEEHGLASTFVGHPVVERTDVRGDGARFRERYGLKPKQPILCMLPGSRMSELKRLLPKFAETADIVLQSRHDAVIVLPTLPHLKPYIEKFFVGKGINPIVTDVTQDKFDCFAASMVAIAASGSVTLELALCDTPHIIAYKLGPFSAWLAKKIIKTPYVNLVNIVMKKTVVPELLLENCEPKPMSWEVLKLMRDREARTAQLTDFRAALIALGLGDPETPGHRGAQAVLQAIGRPVPEEGVAGTEAEAA
ncbi:MAG: lipid-A-disaccharide synthase [Alphaproteobacteria bacterium]|nr:lipid-A-disaccharide synthase [Alphaproteobacteria bacterium]